MIDGAGVIPTIGELKRKPSFSRRQKRVTSEETQSSVNCTGDLVSRLRDSDDCIYRRQLYEERMERARSNRRMTQESFDDILQAIDQSEPSNIDDSNTESFSDELDKEQEEGIFVRDQKGWVDIDQYAPPKIVFRFKWKRSNKSNQPAKSTNELTTP